MDYSRRMGLVALASLPLWVAMLTVWLFAQDLSEMAAAAMASGLLVTLIGLGAIALVTRRSGTLLAEHHLVVSQSLALVDCMKQINRRVMHIESGAAPGLAPPAALATTTTMALPLAHNDGAAQPAQVPALTDRAADDGVVSQPWIALESGMPHSSRVALSSAAEAGGHDGAALAHAALRLHAQGRGVELRLPGAAAGRLACLATLAGRCTSDPDTLRGVLIGLDREALRACVTDHPRLFAQLAQAGVRLALNVDLPGATDFRPTGEALAHGAITRLVVNGPSLARAIAEAPGAALAWSMGLAGHGVCLAADLVADARMARLLAAFDVVIGIGPGVDAAGAGESAVLPTAPAELAPADHRPHAAAAAAQPVKLPWRASPHRRAG